MATGYTGGSKTTVTSNGAKPPVKPPLNSPGRQIPSPAMPPPPKPKQQGPVDLRQAALGAPIHQINDTVQKVSDNHMKMFGVQPKPGLVYDVVRGVMQGVVKDVDGIFQIPRNSHEAKVFKVTPPQPKEVTDPGAAQAIVKAQGHPLTPQQKTELGLARGDLTQLQAKHRLIEAGILPRLQIIHDEGDIFNQIVAGGYLAASGLIMGAPILGYEEFIAAKKAVGQRSLDPLGKANYAIGKGIVQKTYNDVKAVATGDMGYLRDNPDAYWNVLLLGLGGAGGASRLSAIAATTAREGVVAGFGEALLRKPPPPKTLTLGQAREAAYITSKSAPPGMIRLYRGEGEGHLTYEEQGLIPGDETHYFSSDREFAASHDSGGGLYYVDVKRGVAADHKSGAGNYELPGDIAATAKRVEMSEASSGATVDALNFTNPVVRMADHFRDAIGRKRSEAHKEPIKAAALRAMHFERAADFISKNWSYEAKFRRELEAYRRTQYQTSVYLARQLDSITASTIDAADAINGLSVTSRKALTIGELKAVQVLAQGGDWREALITMRNAHRTFRDATRTAGFYLMAQDHKAQLAALQLAEKVLEDGERDGFRKVFRKALPLITEALQEGQNIKINKLGLDPEVADLRDALEYDVYKRQRTIADRKKLAGLITATEANVEKLAGSKGFVVPKLLEKRESALQAIRDAKEKITGPPEGLTKVYHGTQRRLTEFSPAETKVSQFGKGVFFTTDPRKAGHYADVGVEPRGSWDPVENRLVSQPTVHIRHIDERTLYDTTSRDAEYVKDVQARLEGIIPRAVKKILYDKNATESQLALPYNRWAGWGEGGDLVEALGIAYNIAIEDGLIAKPKGDLVGTDLANRAFAKLGFTGYKSSSTERFIFDPKDIHPGANPELLDALTKAEKAYDRAHKEVSKAQEEEHPNLAAARKRLESLNKLMAETEERVRTAEKREGAHRLPIYPRSEEVSGSVRVEFPSRNANRFGEYLPKVPDEITHSFGGKTLLAGNIRLDFTNLVARELGRTVRAAMLVDDYYDKLKSAVPQPPEGPTAKFYAPIRKTAAVSPKIKEMVNRIEEPGLTTEDIIQLSESEVENWNQMAYGGKQNPDGTWIFPPGTKIKDYAWYDRRAYPEQHDLHTAGWHKYLQTTYNIIGRPKIFLAPRYLLNTLSNKHMLWLDQGAAWTPVSMTASHFSNRIYGERFTRFVDELMGNSRARSYGPNSKEGVLSGWMSGVANFMHVMTDLHDRRAAFFYHAWKMGYTSREKMLSLRDPENVNDLNQISRRANKSVVELGNLTWVEQQNLRHLIFVYPWRSRQALWSIRTLAEHPARSAVLAMIGENALESDLDNKPHWMQAAIKKYLDIGYVVTGWTPSGEPMAIGAGQINTFSGLNDILHPKLNNIGGPGVQLGVEAATGNDRFGKAFTGSQGEKLVKAFLDVAIEQQPITLSTKRGKKFEGQPSVPKEDFSNRGSLLAQISAGKKRVALSPGWLDGYGLLLSGGATERVIDKHKSFYDYYHGLDDKHRHAFERKLLFRVLKLQGEMLGKRVPTGVSTAVDVANEVSYRLNQMSKTHGMSEGIPDAMHDAILIGVLKDRGLIDKQTATDEMTKIEKIKGLSATDHSQSRTALMVKYAGGKQLQQWDQDVKLLHSYGEKTFPSKLARLRDTGLYKGAPGHVSQDALYELGRKVIAYEAKVRDLSNAASHEADPVRKAALETALTVYINKHDEPNGKLPSEARLSYADTPAKDRKDHLVSVTGQKWSTLSNLDKELLTGRKVDPVVSEAWDAINERMAQEKARLKPGQSLPDGLRNYYVNRIAKQSPEFAADVRFQAQPRAVQIATFKPIKASRFSGEWGTLLTTAAQFASDRIKAGWVHGGGKPDWTAIQKDWSDNIPKLREWIGQQPAGFRRELAQYQPGFLQSLVRP